MISLVPGLTTGNLNGVLGDSKRDLKKQKNKTVLEHHETVERSPKGHPRLVDNCLLYVYQFLTSNSNFKTTSNLKISPFLEDCNNLYHSNFTSPMCGYRVVSEGLIP